MVDHFDTNVNLILVLAAPSDVGLFQGVDMF